MFEIINDTKPETANILQSVLKIYFSVSAGELAIQCTAQTSGSLGCRRMDCM